MSKSAAGRGVLKGADGLRPFSWGVRGAQCVSEMMSMRVLIVGDDMFGLVDRCRAVDQLWKNWLTLSKPTVLSMRLTGRKTKKTVMIGTLSEQMEVVRVKVEHWRVWADWI